jgi:hypothetical protein
MFAIRFISSAKIWLTVFVAVMMSFATVTPDIHPVEPDEIACQDEGGIAQVSNEHSPEQPNKAPHDHHAHNCGSCHIHATTLHFASLKPFIADTLGYNLNAFDAAPRAGPMGLYRPPRA